MVNDVWIVERAYWSSFEADSVCWRVCVFDNDDGWSLDSEWDRKNRQGGEREGSVGDKGVFWFGFGDSGCLEWEGWDGRVICTRRWGCGSGFNKVCGWSCGFDWGCGSVQRLFPQLFPRCLSFFLNLQISPFFQAVFSVFAVFSFSFSLKMKMKEWLLLVL